MTLSAALSTISTEALQYIFKRSDGEYCFHHRTRTFRRLAIVVGLDECSPTIATVFTATGMPHSSGMTGIRNGSADRRDLFCRCSAKCGALIAIDALGIQRAADRMLFDRVDLAVPAATAIATPFASAILSLTLFCSSRSLIW